MSSRSLMPDSVTDSKVVSRPPVVVPPDELSNAERAVRVLGQTLNKVTASNFERVLGHCTQTLSALPLSPIPSLCPLPSVRVAQKEENAPSVSLRHTTSFQQLEHHHDYYQKQLEKMQSAAKDDSKFETYAKLNITSRSLRPSGHALAAPHSTAGRGHRCSLRFVRQQIASS